MDEGENKSNLRSTARPSGEKEILQPAGWLITVQEPDFGKAYPLRCGKNSIGRAENMDVAIRRDLTVSRKEHAWIEYRSDTKEFVVSAGMGRSLIYVNDDPVFQSMPMKKNDILYVGDSALMLIPCCDENFSWKNCRL